MFGFKRKKVYTKNQYSVESLYEAVRNHKFTAGTPELFSIAYASIITFPPLDRNNQIWIEDDTWVKWYQKGSVPEMAYPYKRTFRRRGVAEKYGT